MTRRRAARVAIAGSAAVVVVVIVVGLILTVTYIRRPLPQRDGEVTLAGLGGEVSVIRDDRGVPQIYADNALDLMRVQGYVHAEDRFFEMDLRRHITAGRLSELVGRNRDALSADAVIRTLGWRRVAQEELSLLSPSTRQYLQAYADGVNDYLRGKSASELSISYTLLARANPLDRIEPWTPVDSLAWLKAVAWDLRTNYTEELERARSITTVKNIEDVEQLYPAYPYAKHPPIVSEREEDRQEPAAATSSNVRKAKTGTTADEGQDDPSRPNSDTPGATAVAGVSDVESALRSGPVQEALTAAAAAIEAVPHTVGGSEGLGSNSWVVSGDLTGSGKPILANDPHLGTSVPGIWYQAGLHCRQVTQECPYDVSGFGFAGMPGIMIGHNEKISWGLTNLYADVTDFYLERVSGDRVESGGAMKPLTIRTEKIEVAGGDPVTIQVRETPHGPLLSDVVSAVGDAGQTAPVAGEEPNRATKYAIALSWTALEPGRSMDAVFAINTSASFDEFRKAAGLLDAPAQNIVYADRDGHIGYQAAGRVPVRGVGRTSSPVPSDGTWPHPGWDSAYDWRGTVPTTSLPWAQDPAEGFIVAANQSVTGPGAEVKISSDWDYGFRATRVRNLLEGAVRDGRKLTVDDMRAMQTDTRNGIAPDLVPLLLQADVTDVFTREAIELLRGWDYSQPTDSAAAAYFNVVWAKLLNLTFSDELPEGFRPDGGDRWFEVVRTLLDKPKNGWWDNLSTPDITESRDEVLRRALVEARLELTRTLGKDPGRWQWGRLHRLRLEQAPLGGSDSPGLVRRLVNRGPYGAPGGSSVVNAMSWDASSGTFDVVAAPSMRMIVDLGNLDGSRWVNQTGVSGHPVDDHYDDQLGAWLDGEDFEWPYSKGAVDEASDEEQTFKPGPGAGPGDTSGPSATSPPAAATPSSSPSATPTP